LPLVFFPPWQEAFGNSGKSGVGFSGLLKLVPFLSIDRCGLKGVVGVVGCSGVVTGVVSLHHTLAYHRPPQIQAT
jgi:hypothetical protein